MDEAPNGILLVDKPAGITSARVVSMVKRLLPRGTKVGHAGTLDLFATGLLIVLVGRATRSCESLMGLPKTYLGTIKFGATTETDDVDSPEIVQSAASAVAESGLRNALDSFTGEIEQTPPKYSALKVGGRRAADRVRDGETVVMKPRTVTIYKLDLVDYTWPIARISVECSRGTYIRSLARDIGEALGVGGYLQALRRTRIGEYEIDRSVTVIALTSDLVRNRLIQPTSDLPPPHQ